MLEVTGFSAFLEKMDFAVKVDLLIVKISNRDYAICFCFKAYFKMQQLEIKNKKTAIFVLLFVLVFLCGALLYIKLNIFPYELQARLFFVLHRQALNALADEMEKHADIRKISVINEVVWLSRSNNDVYEKSKPDLADRLIKLIKQTKTPISWKLDDGILIYLFSFEKFNKHFELSFMRRKLESFQRICSNKLLKQEYGECDFQLGKGWLLDYSWRPLVRIRE